MGMSEVYELTTGILFSGNLMRPCVHAKAMESRGLFFYLGEELHLQLPKLRLLPNFAQQAQDLSVSTRALGTVYDIVLQNGPVVPAVDRQRALDNIVAHLSLLEKVGCKYAPKHHIGWEMIRHMGWTGNCRHNSEYPDESFNRILGQMSASVHPAVFAKAVMCKYRIYCMAIDREL
jgi:hypothetical protein